MAISGERTTAAETIAAFAGSKVFGEKTLYVIVSANIPTVLPTPSTVSLAAPAVPSLPPRVLSTANSADVTIIGSPGDSAVPVLLKNFAEASCPT
jgi:hypothetical protein